jgi:hypothetical protein
MRGREAGSLGSIKILRSFRLKSMAKIFLAHDHIRGIHNTSVT